MAEANGYFPENRRNREDNPLLEELKRYQSAGVRITLKNAAVPLDYIAKICGVREKGAYMCDFVADEQNRLIRINFDKVEKGKHPVPHRTVYTPMREQGGQTGNKAGSRYKKQ